MSMDSYHIRGGNKLMDDGLATSYRNMTIRGSRNPRDCDRNSIPHPEPSATSFNWPHAKRTTVYASELFCLISGGVSAKGFHACEPAFEWTATLSWHTVQDQGSALRRQASSRRLGLPVPSVRRNTGRIASRTYVSKYHDPADVPTTCLRLCAGLWGPQP